MVSMGRAPQAPWPSSQQPGGNTGPGQPWAPKPRVSSFLRQAWPQHWCLQLTTSSALVWVQSGVGFLALTPVQPLAQ